MPIAALLLASGIAAAQPAPDRLSSLTVACAPASASTRLLDLVSGSRSLFDLAGSPAALLLALPTEPAAAAQAGIDLSGPLVFHRSAAGVGARVRLTDPARAEAALLSLGMDPTPAAGAGWLVAGPGRAPWVARAAGADLVVADAPLPDAALPAQPGCRVDAALGGPVGALDAFLPADASQPVVVGVQPPVAPPASLARSRGAPVPGTSTAPPVAVVSLGVPGLELLADLAAQPGLAGAIDPADIRQLGRILRVEPGATVALWVDDGSPRFAASIPVAGGRGQALRPRAVTRQLRRRLSQEASLTVTRRGAAALQVAGPGKAPLEVVVQRDRLLLGNAALAVSESARGVGQPWVDADFVAFAAQAPVALEAHLDRLRLPLPATAPLRLGLRTDGPRAELLLAGGDGKMVPQLLFLAQMLKASRDEARPPRVRPELEP